MKPQYEVLMAGSGGQGLVFLASFLAEAAIQDGKNVVQTQSYGIAQRGGFISAEVLVDQGEILFQQVLDPNIIVALHDCVGTRYDDAKAPVLYDSGLMKARSFSNWYGVPFSLIAQDLNAPRATNLVAVGAMIQTLPVVSFEALAAVANRRFAPAVAEVNIAAIKGGMKAAEKFAQKA